MARKLKMETKERYEITECPQNGTGSPPAALEVAEWWEEGRITVQLEMVQKRGTERGSIIVRRQVFNPTELFADLETQVLPYGTALEKLIEQGRQQAEQS